MECVNQMALFTIFKQVQWLSCQNIVNPAFLEFILELLVNFDISVPKSVKFVEMDKILRKELCGFD